MRYNLGWYFVKAYAIMGSIDKRKTLERQDIQCRYYTKAHRGKEEAVTASMAILKGLAEDGGLFVPTEIPKLDVPMDKLAQNELSGDRL